MPPRAQRVYDAVSAGRVGVVRLRWSLRRCLCGSGLRADPADRGREQRAADGGRDQPGPASLPLLRALQGNAEMITRTSSQRTHSSPVTSCRSTYRQNDRVGVMGAALPDLPPRNAPGDPPQQVRQQRGPGIIRYVAGAIAAS